MSLESVKYHAALVGGILRENGHAALATAVQRLTGELDIESRIDRALDELMDHCHVRALGDLHIASMAWSEWLDVVEKLQQACSRALQGRGVADREDGPSRAHFEQDKPRGAEKPPKSTVFFGERSTASTPPAPPAEPATPEKGDSGGGIDGAGQLIVALMLVLFLGLATAGVNIFLRLPSPSTPETVEVTGRFLRAEPVPKILPRSFNGWIHLSGDDVAYGVWDPGFGWGYTMQAARRGDPVTLLVDKEAYERETARQAQLAAKMVRSDNAHDVGQLVARSVDEAKQNSVPVVQIAVAGRVTMSRIHILEQDLRALILWGIVGLTMLGLIGGIGIYDWRRRAGHGPEAYFPI